MRIFHSSPGQGHAFRVFMRTNWGNGMPGMQDSKRLFSHHISLHYITLHYVTLHCITWHIRLAQLQFGVGTGGTPRQKVHGTGNLHLLQIGPTSAECAVSIRHGSNISSNSTLGLSWAQLRRQHRTQLRMLSPSCVQTCPSCNMSGPSWAQVGPKLGPKSGPSWLLFGPT